MTRSRSARRFTAVVVATLLAGFFTPVGAGMLVCIGDDPSDTCCRPAGAQQPGAPGAEQRWDAGDCDCCIAVAAMPSSVDPAPKKLGLGSCAGLSPRLNVVEPRRPRPARTAIGDCLDVRLAALRTTLLRI